jgi:hypothetical protein
MLRQRPGEREAGGEGVVSGPLVDVRAPVLAVSLRWGVSAAGLSVADLGPHGGAVVPVDSPRALAGTEVDLLGRVWIGEPAVNLNRLARVFGHLRESRSNWSPSKRPER